MLADTSAVDSSELTEAEKAEARRLADDYLTACGEGGEQVHRLRQQVVTSSKGVSDLMAEHYAQRMRAGDPYVAPALGNQLEAMWFESGRQILLAALRETNGYALSILSLERGPVRRELKPTTLAGRILGVFLRPWVLAFCALPIVIACVLVISVASGIGQLIGALAIAAALASIVMVDARMRRCPACHRLLAGMFMGVRSIGTYTEHVTVETIHGGHATVDRSVGAVSRIWVCAQCKYRWET